MELNPWKGEVATTAIENTSILSSDFPNHSNATGSRSYHPSPCLMFDVTVARPRGSTTHAANLTKQWGKGARGGGKIRDKEICLITPPRIQTYSFVPLALRTSSITPPPASTMWPRTCGTSRRRKKGITTFWRKISGNWISRRGRLCARCGEILCLSCQI